MPSPAVDESAQSLLEHANRVLSGEHADSVLSDFLTHTAMAQELGIHERTLSRLHTKRIGPPRIKLGKKVLYHRPSVIAWLASQQEEDQRKKAPYRKKAQAAV
jgi:hypothetical protein